MGRAASAAVIGGGVVGLCTALRLAEQKFSVTLVDAPPPLGAPSWGNIGHIATEQCTPLASWSNIRSVPRRLSAFGGAVGLPLGAAGAWLPFGLRMMRAARHSAAGTQALAALLQDALPAWRRLDAIWPQARVLQDEGHFVVWESARTAEAGRAAWAAATIGTASFRDASKAELDGLKALAPGHQLQAIRFSNTGKITDLQQLQANLRARLEDLGASLWPRKVRQLHLKAGAAQIAFDDGEILAPDVAVVCAGAASSELLTPVGHQVPMIAERGYHLECETSPVAASTLPMAFEDRSVMVNRFRHGLRIAGFVEFATLSTPPDPGKWQRLEQHLTELGIKRSGVMHRWMGARPTLPDYLPAIGKSSKASNLFYAFGHQHLGLTLAPITAEWIAGVVMSQDGRTAYALERFG